MSSLADRIWTKRKFHIVQDYMGSAGYYTHHEEYKTMEDARKGARLALTMECVDYCIIYPAEGPLKVRVDRS